MRGSVRTSVLLLITVVYATLSQFAQLYREVMFCSSLAPASFTGLHQALVNWVEYVLLLFRMTLQLNPVNLPHVCISKCIRLRSGFQRYPSTPSA